MKPKEVAKQIIAESAEIGKEATLLKDGAEKFVKDTLKRIKDKTGQVLTEAEFLKVIAEIINMLVVDKYIPNPAKFIVKKLGLSLKALKLLDKYILDQWFGKNWYFNMSNYLK